MIAITIDEAFAADGDSDAGLVKGAEGEWNRLLWHKVRSAYAGGGWVASQTKQHLYESGVGMIMASFGEPLMRLVQSRPLR